MTNQYTNCIKFLALSWKILQVFIQLFLSPIYLNNLPRIIFFYANSQVFLKFKYYTITLFIKYFYKFNPLLRKNKIYYCIIMLSKAISKELWPLYLWGINVLEDLAARSLSSVNLMGRVTFRSFHIRWF